MPGLFRKMGDKDDGSTYKPSNVMKQTLIATQEQHLTWEWGEYSSCEPALRAAFENLSYLTSTKAFFSSLRNLVMKTFKMKTKPVMCSCEFCTTEQASRADSASQQGPDWSSCEAESPCQPLLLR